jgi:hypothetical protein
VTAPDLRVQTVFTHEESGTKAPAARSIPRGPRGRSVGVSPASKIAIGIYAGRQGTIHKFAEPETRWEAYISGKPGQERRNLAVWETAGDRLGAFGGGGYGADSFDLRTIAPHLSQYTTNNSNGGGTYNASVHLDGTFYSHDPTKIEKNIMTRLVQAQRGFGSDPIFGNRGR